VSPADAESLVLQIDRSRPSCALLRPGRVERKGGKTWIHLSHDHGLRVKDGKTTEVFSMWRTYEGEEWFVLER
jgi:hypothetical protein